MRGTVAVNGQTVRRASQNVPDNAVIDTEADPYVSRGAHKLAHALKAFGFDVKGALALDVGASTGGFTDVLLRQDVRHVVCLDVGRGQLAADLAADSRVTVCDGINARELAATSLPFAPTMIVVDVSFISLTLVLPAVLASSAAKAQLVALVKPQFEVGRAAVGKGGIVRDDAATAAALARVEATIESAKFRNVGRTPSPIQGGDGNQEWLVGAVRP